MRATSKNHQIILKLGDITEERVGAIVNAANSRLVLGAGVAGAIARAGGPSIQKECSALGSTPVGTAVITGSGRLPATHVIHAVGPRMGEGDEDRKLHDAVESSLTLGANTGLRSIAFPAIGTGVFGFPMDRCAEISTKTAIEFCDQHDLPERIHFVLFGDSALDAFANALRNAAETAGWNWEG